MTRNEMLKRMKLTDEELKDLVLKFKNLQKSLNKQQRAVIRLSMPRASDAAKTFGADVTAKELKELLGTESTSISFGAHGLNQVKIK
jgi:hypothetical protein